MRIVYLVLAVVGAVVPMYYFIKWFEEFGYDLAAMNDAWFVADASRGLTYDLTIAWVALIVWTVFAIKQRKAWANPIVSSASFIGGSARVEML